MVLAQHLYLGPDMTSLCNWLPWTPSVLTIKLVKANRAAYCASNSTATYMIQADIGIGGGGDWNLKSESTFPFALAGKKSIKRWAIRWTLGCVNPASWLPLAAGRKFTQLRAHLIAPALFCSHIAIKLSCGTLPQGYRKASLRLREMSDL